MHRQAPSLLTRVTKKLFFVLFHSDVLSLTFHTDVSHRAAAGHYLYRNRCRCAQAHRHSVTAPTWMYHQAGLQSESQLSDAVHHNKRTQTMQRTTTLVRLLAIVAVFGLATLALPLSAQARVGVSIGIGGPVYPTPVVVAPAPVVVAPPPPAVVYPAPVVVAPPPVVYGSAPVVVGGSTAPTIGTGDIITTAGIAGNPPELGSRPSLSLRQGRAFSLRRTTPLPDASCKTREAIMLHASWSRSPCVDAQSVQCAARH